MKQNLINLNLLQSKVLKNKQKIVILTSNNKESEYVVKKLQKNFNQSKILTFPDREILPYDHFSTPDPILKQRIKVINSFDDAQILVSSFKNLFDYYPEKKFFLSKQLIKRSDQFNFNKFISMLKSMNFLKVEKVNAVGEFTVRGGIVDLHAINYENPLRLEFFDNKIESIRTYSLESQLSIDNLDEIYIGDSNEIPLNTEVVKYFKSKWREYFIDNDESECSFFQKISSNKLPDGYEIYFSLLIKSPVNFLDIFEVDNLYLSSEIQSNNLINEYKKFIDIRYEDENIGHKRPILDPKKCFFNINKILKKFPNIKIIDFNFKRNNSEIEVKIKEKNKVLNHRNFELNIGDHVIHKDYGLGLFEGFQNIKTSNHENEFGAIKYRNNEFLYLPTSQFNLISKHHKKNFENKSLDSLSKSNWNFKKQKIKSKIEDHAAEILYIESQRAKSTSIPLKIEKSLLKKFLNDFPFQDTLDQIKVTQEIIKDLSLVKPMNRLLCGDVGFGKTEIAIRASFISAFSCRQVIILTPSTVLTEQHFTSFKKRLDRYPINIQKISRNVSSKNRKKIISRFNETKIDILIGTHALLNDDFDLSNLGLLIVDEEHKFGTKQKNIIKEKQSSSHILYMSATPIPKTMNMAFTGIKDFSYLYTAPSNRLPVKTFLEIFSKSKINEAIEREINRGGSVFFIENNISKLEQLADILKIWLPKYNINYLHAQLDKKIINSRLDRFREGSIDILICSTIVEMGLDIPQANTIIINNAQKFGVSQLHQLRGRIGRSNIQGYCYLMIPDNDIPKKSRSRIDILVENSFLGSGFKISEEDLELRGAGELLGNKQSGHVDTIGLSLYFSMLKDALKTDVPKDKTVIIKLLIPAYLPESFLPSTNERLRYYQRLSSSNIKVIKNIENELKDRCGKFPDEVLNLIELSILKRKMMKLSISKIVQTQNYIKFDFDQSKLSSLIFKKLIDLSSIKNELILIKPDNKVWLKYKNNNVLKTVQKFINELS